MDNNKIYKIEGNEIPYQLTQIPQPPKKLYVMGNLPKENSRILCIVGARKYSNYGEEVTNKLIDGLKGYNICIVSGLAFGIDAIAHRAAIKNGLQTVAFPGSGLDKKVLYPFKHHRLAEEIVYNGGGLISEFEMNQHSFNWTFPQRNRLMAGISDASIIIEAKKGSGSQITARLSLDYNRNLGAVPGDIRSQLSELPNSLIRDGAIPITSSQDILEMLGYDIHKSQPIQNELLLNRTENERKIIELLQTEPHSSDMLISKIDLDIIKINEILTLLEIDGLIRSKGNGFTLR